MTVTLLVVALNEEEGMRAIMPTIDESLFEQILVLDGQSQDGTVAYSKEMGYDVYVQKKRGLNNAYREVWPLIKGDYVLTFSPDGNCLVEDLRVLIEKVREGYDMVIGSRYFKGAKSQDDDIVTAFGNSLFTGTINFLFNAQYTDAMTIYRIYRTDLFNILQLDQKGTYSFFEKMYFTKIGVEPILSTRVAKERFKCADILSIEPPRIYGERKLQIIRWGLAYMTQIVFEKFKPRLTNNE